MENNQNIFSGLLNEFPRLLNKLGLAWWIEVATGSPRCTYYFGPFSSVGEANAAQAGYVEDLEKEGAQEIVVDVKRCRPGQLTIEEPASPSGSLVGQW